MSAASQTSAQLSAAIAGDDASLAWLVTRLSPWLVAQARWRLGALPVDLCDAEDLVQDAWLIALPRLGALPSRDGRITPVLLRFLSTTILNRINNVIKARLRRGGREQVLTTSAEGSVVSARVTGVVTAAVREERRHLVLEAIDELEPLDQQILLLRAVEQRSGNTTAELLGISVDAVTMRYCRARERLRGRLPAALLEEIG